MKSKLSRINPDFEKWAREIAKKRYTSGMDKKELKLPRLTKAITNVPKLKEILEGARIDDK